MAPRVDGGAFEDGRGKQRRQPSRHSGWVSRWGEVAIRAAAGFEFLFQRTPVPSAALSTATAKLLADIGVEAPAA